MSVVPLTPVYEGTRRNGRPSNLSLLGLLDGIFSSSPFITKDNKLLSTRSHEVATKLREHNAFNTSGDGDIDD